VVDLDLEGARKVADDHRRRIFRNTRGRFPKPWGVGSGPGGQEVLARTGRIAILLINNAGSRAGRGQSGTQLDACLAEKLSRSNRTGVFLVTSARAVDSGHAQPPVRSHREYRVD